MIYTVQGNTFPFSIIKSPGSKPCPSVKSRDPPPSLLGVRGGHLELGVRVGPLPNAAARPHGLPPAARLRHQPPPLPRELRGPVLPPPSPQPRWFASEHPWATRTNIAQNQTISQIYISIVFKPEILNHIPSGLNISQGSAQRGSTRNSLTGFFQIPTRVHHPSRLLCAAPSPPPGPVAYLQPRGAFSSPQAGGGARAVSGNLRRLSTRGPAGAHWTGDAVLDGTGLRTMLTIFLF